MVNCFRLWFCSSLLSVNYLVLRLLWKYWIRHTKDSIFTINSLVADSTECIIDRDCNAKSTSFDWSGHSMIAMDDTIERNISEDVIQIFCIFYYNSNNHYYSVQTKCEKRTHYALPHQRIYCTESEYRSLSR